MKERGWARLAGTSAIVGGIPPLLEGASLLLLIVPRLAGPSALTLTIAQLFETFALPSLMSLLLPLLVVMAVIYLATLLWHRHAWLARLGMALVVLGMLGQVLGEAARLAIVGPKVYGPDGPTVFLSWVVGIGLFAYLVGLWLVGNAMRRARPLAFGNTLLLLIAVVPVLDIAVNYLVSQYLQGLASSNSSGSSGLDGLSSLGYLPSAISTIVVGLAWIVLGVAPWRGVPRGARVRAGGGCWGIGVPG